MGYFQNVADSKMRWSAHLMHSRENTSKACRSILIGRADASICDYYAAFLVFFELDPTSSLSPRQLTLLLCSQISLTMDEEKRSSRGSEGADVEAQHAGKEQLDTASVDDRTGNNKEEDVSDPNIVNWDGPNDQQNPMNWTGKAKTINTLLIIVLTLLTPLASSMFAPGVPDVLLEFGISTSGSIPELVVSVSASRCVPPKPKC